MEIHLLKDKDLIDFCQKGTMKDALTLLVVGLCEVHSNATLFGGIESVSFKIKLKQIKKRGNKIINYIKENS